MLELPVPEPHVTSAIFSENYSYPARFRTGNATEVSINLLLSKLTQSSKDNHPKLQMSFRQEYESRDTFT